MSAPEDGDRTPTAQPEPEAVEAAERMNDPDGPQPGVVDDPPEADEHDPLPETMQ